MSYQPVEIPYNNTSTLPPNAILESGGGIVNFAHGYGAPYVEGSERNDVYGSNNNPYGNMYNMGMSSYQSQQDHYSPPYKYDTIEKFDLNEVHPVEPDNYELIEVQDDKSIMKMFWKFLLYIILFISVLYWTKIIDKFIQKHFDIQNETNNTRNTVIVAVILTATFFLGMYLLKETNLF